LATAPTLAYRTVLKDGSIAIEWLGTRSFSARDLTGGPTDDRSLRREAAEILFLLLQNGALPARQVIERAREHAVAKRTLERAKTDLGVKSFGKEDNFGFFHGFSWMWPLPEAENELLRRFREKYYSPPENTTSGQVVRSLSGS
jgi:hypothetical protein